MDIHTFISYFLSTILVILGSSLVINKKFFKKILKDLETNSLGLYMSSIIGFFLGLFIVVNTNGFTTPENVVISTLGYLMTFKSIAFLILPDVMIKITKKTKNMLNYIRYIGVIYISLGIYLMYLQY